MTAPAAPLARDASEQRLRELIAAAIPDPKNWPAPQPRWNWGRSFSATSIACWHCDWGASSLSNIDGLERAYKRHWWLEHENQNWSA